MLIQYSYRYMLSRTRYFLKQGCYIWSVLGSSFAHAHRDRAGPLLMEQKTIGNRVCCAGVSVVVLQFFCTHCVLLEYLCGVVGVYHAGDKAK